MELQIKQQRIQLLPEGAAYWVNTKSLLIADAHLGKIAHFRKNGFAVPPQIQYSFYKKMETLLATLSVKRIFFLGDLFHSDRNKEWERFSEWNQQNSFPSILVKGNHDILPDFLLEQSGLRVEEEWFEAGLCLTHHPQQKVDHVNLCGHVHPGVRLQGQGRQRLKVPCFFYRPNQLILPAFGVFTGLHIMQPSTEDQVYALGEKHVLAISIRKK